MIYIVCFMVSAAFSWLASRTKDRAAAFVCSAAAILVLCILGGLRDVSIGTDSRAYKIVDYDTAASSGSFFDYASSNRHELGWQLITYLCCKVLGSFNWALFVYQLITVSCFYIGAYKHRKVFSLPFFMLIFCLMHYNRSYNLIRQFIAASIIFMGIDCMEKKQYLKFSVYIIVAYFFHSSAIMNFPLLIGFHMLTTSKRVTHSQVQKLLLVIGMTAFLMSVRPLVSIFTGLVSSAAKYQYYLNETGIYNEMHHATIPILIMATQFLAMTFYGQQAKKVVLPADGGIVFHQFMLIFCIIYQLAVKFFTTRALMYFEFTSLLSLAALPRFVRNKYLNFVLYAGTILVAAFYWWRVYVYGESSETYPYVSIL